MNKEKLEASRTDKLNRLVELGIDPWGSKVSELSPICYALSCDCNYFAEITEPESVKIAGRVVARRVQGKLHFLSLQDRTGRLQVMIGSKQVGEEAWQIAENIDLGDIIAVKGVFGKTQKGEPTIRAESLTFLSKSLEPHPSDFYGLADEEYRLRHRYLDLIYTPESSKRVLDRATIIKSIRNCLDRMDFIEVETPMLQSSVGGAAARPFSTHHNALGIDLHLRIALELPLKKLLVGGLERVYEMSRVFRNEGISRKHNPEFTMLELYMAYSDLKGMMDITQDIIEEVLRELVRDKYKGSSCSFQDLLKLPYGDRVINFNPAEWERLSYTSLFERYVDVPMFDTKAVAEKYGSNPTGKAHEVLVHELFERFVEPELEKFDVPVFVYNYPAGLCPLTKRTKSNPLLAERFELYIAGMEIANAYTELNDPVEQEKHFRNQLAGLPADESMARMDDDFIRALRHGMPPAGGLGIGIDRLVMLLTNTTSIRDVILFPQLKPCQQ